LAERDRPAAPHTRHRKRCRWGCTWSGTSGICSCGLSPAPPARPDRLDRVIGATRIILKPAEASHAGHRSSAWGRVPRHKMKLSGRLPDGGDQRGTSRGETSPSSGSVDIRGDHPRGDAADDSDHHGTTSLRRVDLDLSLVGAGRVIGHYQRKRLPATAGGSLLGRRELLQPGHCHSCFRGDQRRRHHPLRCRPRSTHGERLSARRRLHRDRLRRH